MLDAAFAEAVAEASDDAVALAAVASAAACAADVAEQTKGQHTATQRAIFKIFQDLVKELASSSYGCLESCAFLATNRLTFDHFD